MKKLFKGLFTVALAVGFLAGCNPSSSTPSDSTPVVKHLVEFYEDNVGKFYLEVEVEHNTKVTQPADPTARDDYDFSGWWIDTAYSEEFDFDTLITADTKIYGKWTFNPPYVEDERTFHLVGGMENTELSYINWNAIGEEGTDWDVRSYLTKAEDSNLFSIEVEVGYLGKFKIKIPGRAWGADDEYNYLDIREEDLQEYLQEADNNNIQVNTAGLYRIELETTWEWVRVTRLGDAVGEGVKQDPAPGSIKDWGIVGTRNTWGDTEDVSLEYYAEGEYYFLPVVHFTENEEFKLRADNAWGVEHGSFFTNEIDEVAFEQAVSLDENGDPVLDENGNVAGLNGNIKVLVEGYFSVYFEEAKAAVPATDDTPAVEAKPAVFIIRALSFALRGDALPGAWDEDSEPLVLEAAPVEDAEEGTLTYTYTGRYEVAEGSVKAKFHQIGQFAGWDYAYGDGADNIAVTAGHIDVTLTIVLDVEALTFDGAVVVVPVV